MQETTSRRQLALLWESPGLTGETGETIPAWCGMTNDNLNIEAGRAQ